MNNLKKFGIHIKVSSFEKSLEFYKDLGFVGIFAYGPEEFIRQWANIPTAPEKYKGVTFELNNALLEIGEAHPAVKPEVFKEAIQSSKVSAMIDVESVQKIKDICLKNNFEIAKDFVTYPWGTKEFVVRDPDGFILVFREVYYM